MAGEFETQDANNTNYGQNAGSQNAGSPNAGNQGGGMQNGQQSQQSGQDAGQAGDQAGGQQRQGGDYGSQNASQQSGANTDGGQQQQYASEGGQDTSQFAGQVREHMEVIGADGVHVGTVDHIDGDRIKLTKKDSGAQVNEGSGTHEGHHHYISTGLIAGIEGDQVRLSATGANAIGFEEEE